MKTFEILTVILGAAMIFFLAFWFGAATQEKFTRDKLKAQGYDYKTTLTKIEKGG
ncbi:MAG: hypothetical protein LBT79_07070 [Elusimicrobiota bacterium]|jgi:predicted permease|nr:hypothetical protein [Elusimicrobiota bacterium]